MGWCSQQARYLQSHSCLQHGGRAATPNSILEAPPNPLSRVRKNLSFTPKPNPLELGTLASGCPALWGTRGSLGDWGDGERLSQATGIRYHDLGNVGLILLGLLNTQVPTPHPNTPRHVAAPTAPPAPQPPSSMQGRENMPRRCPLGTPGLWPSPGGVSPIPSIPATTRNPQKPESGPGAAAGGVTATGQPGQGWKGCKGGPGGHIPGWGGGSGGRCGCLGRRSPKPPKPGALQPGS